MKKIRENDYKRIVKEDQRRRDEYLDLRRKNRELEEANSELERKLNRAKFGDVGGKPGERVVDASIFFCAGVANFIRKYGGYVWITDYIDKLSEEERRDYRRAAENMMNWANALVNNITIRENELIYENNN